MNTLKVAAYDMDRLGSKESIVSIDTVEIKEPKEVGSDQIETRLYFPQRYAEPGSLRGRYYTQTFWRGGWASGDVPVFEEYVIPGTSAPLSSGKISVNIRDGRAYWLGSEEILIF